MRIVDTFIVTDSLAFRGLRRLLNLLLLAYVACLLLCSLQTVAAHPVAQGAMEIRIDAERIGLVVTASQEEVAVANAWSGKHSSLDLAAVRSHGEYLLAHLHVLADGQALNGQVVETPNQISGRLSYRLDYKSSGAAQHFEFSQNVLRELSFAPGNPWEASYIVKTFVAGRAVAEGLLFTAQQPLRIAAQDFAKPGQLALTGGFVQHGVLHILRGYDHLLFIGALVLAAPSWFYLLKVIGLFTLAHTLTLILAVLDIVRLPAAIVEPMIAASIVVIAMQNMFWPGSKQGWPRLLFAFGFGLFHGLGFAGGLLEAMSGMAGGHLALAIIAFSAGVEIGHLSVVLPGFYLIRLLLTAKNSLAVNRFPQYASGLISLCGLVYFYAAVHFAGV